MGGRGVAGIRAGTAQSACRNHQLSARDGTDMIMLKIKPCCSLRIQRTNARNLLRLRAALLISALVVLLSGCGGGESSSSSSRNPAPSASSISPTSAPAGSRAVTLTVTGSGFISSSVVRWNGADRATTYKSSTQLTAEISPADLANAGSAQVTVFNPAPGGGVSGSLVFTVNSVEALSFLTARLPDAARDKEYVYALQANGGIKPYTWTIASGTLPGGLSLSTDGVLSGTAAAVSEDTTYPVAINVSDNAYQAHGVLKSFTIRARAGNLGRNDTCDNATPASNGVIRASISPFGDVDVFAFHGTAGRRVTAEIYAQRLTLYEGSDSTDVFLNPFLEILDADCNTIHYADDIIPGVNRDSRISNFTLQDTGTYYLRISDLRGDGRPDFIYELHLSGAD